jgi:hypothetical protein
MTRTRRQSHSASCWHARPTTCGRWRLPYPSRFACLIAVPDPSQSSFHLRQLRPDRRGGSEQRQSDYSAPQNPRYRICAIVLLQRSGRCKATSHQLEPDSTMSSTRSPLHTVTLPGHVLATAVKDMMWAVALATTRIAVVTTAQALAFWSRMLRPPALPVPMSLWRPSCAPFSTSSHQPGACDPARAPETALAHPAPGGSPAFASYRTPSGHASAQVVTTRGA